MPLSLYFRQSLLSIGFLLAVSGETSSDSPNIILIVADDLGYNDVPWHNPLVRAPALSRLAAKGVILEQAYVQPICTPSRSALLTGRYPFHLGRQHDVLWPREPTGLTLNATLLPQRLRDTGYRTHMVGKWHLGFCKRQYTPTARGFQSFLGYWTGSEDYYWHTRGLDGDQWGLDFRRNLSVARRYAGSYSAEVFADEAVRIINDHPRGSSQPRRPLFLYLAFQSVHAPLMVPRRYWKLYPGVKDHNRRTYLGMVSALDDAVAQVEKALHKTGLYQNTVIIFTTDNGGQILAGGNNFPLRGNKVTLWEGGTRAASFVHSPLLEQRRYVNHQLIHITDWYPTLLGLAGAPAIPDDSKLDGFDQWETISKNASSPREEMVYNIDVEKRMSAALRVGNWKLIWGWPGSKSGWYPEPGITTAWGTESDELSQPRYRLAGIRSRHSWSANNNTWLFDLRSDPTERQDLSAQRPDLVAALKHRVLRRAQNLVPADSPGDDPAGNPNAHGHLFATGWC